MSVQKVRLTRTSMFWISISAGAIWLWLFCVFCGSVEFGLYLITQQFKEKNLLSALIVFGSMGLGIAAVLAAMAYGYRLILEMSDKMFEPQFARKAPEPEDGSFPVFFVLKFMVVAMSWPFLGIYLWGVIVKTFAPEGESFLGLMLSSGHFAVMLMSLSFGGWLYETIWPE